MSKFRFLISLSTSVAFILFSGCKPLKQGTESSGSAADTSCPPLVQLIATPKDFHAKLSAFGKEENLMIWFRSDEAGNIRVLGVAETGFKFFDIRYDLSGSHEVVYVFEKLNRKPVVRILVQSFWPLVLPSLNQKRDCSRYNSQTPVTGIKASSDVCWYYLDAESLLPRYIETWKGMNMRFERDSSNMKSIAIDHAQARFKMVLTPVKEL